MVITFLFSLSPFFAVKTKRRKLGKQKTSKVSSIVFHEINVDELPETITKSDETGKPIIVKTMQDGKYQITAGTLDALIEALADQNQPDSQYIDVFLQTYRNFTTPPELLSKLKARFCQDKMRVIKEVQPTKKDTPASTAPEFEDLDADTIQLVKLRWLSSLSSPRILFPIKFVSSFSSFQNCVSD